MIKLNDLILLNNEWDFDSTLKIIVFVKSEQEYTSDFCRAADALRRYRTAKVLAFSRDIIVIEF